MLTRIQVQNFAIIDQVEIEFGPGFSVLSGETGAGKSILIDALILALGGKASPDQIRTGAESAEIEAVFEIDPGSELAGLLNEQGLIDAGEVILRRQVAAAGKSRAWINAHTVPLSNLYSVGRKLVDIYGQHEYQTLLAADQHLFLLDGYAGVEERLNRYHDLYRDYQAQMQEFEKQRMSEQERKERVDFLQFRVSELERAKLKPGEEEELEIERERLKHGETLRAASDLAFQELYNQDGSIAEKIARIQSELDKAAKFDPRLAELAKNLGEARAALEETGAEAGDYVRGLNADPARLLDLEDRLAELRRLKRKYQLGLGEMIALAESSRKELDQLANYESRSAELEGKLEQKRKETLSRAAELSKERKDQAKTLAKKMEQLLKELGMEKCKFEARFEQMETPGPDGIDQVEFYLSPNPGEDLKPLSKIASGGELSRIMLALRGILAKKLGAPVMIFDEVDAGIGGAVAEVVGKKLKELSGRNQVLCVTHLAQIARFADRHYSVWKQTEKSRTVTRIKGLAPEERVEELARMLGGIKITDKTRAFAREMLEESQK